MKYLTAEKIALLDEVALESGKVGVIVGFDKVNERDYVEVRLKGEHVGKLWASTNAVKKAKILSVKHK